MHGNIIAKLEFFNPLGSVKDRIGLSMINEAEKVSSDSVFIEATSGNTGIALALSVQLEVIILSLLCQVVCQLKEENAKLLGAKIILTPKELGMNGAIEEAKKIAKKLKIVLS